MADKTAADAFGPSTENRAKILYCIVGTLVPTTAVIVALRFYTRKLMSNAIRADDWVCLISMGLVIAMSSTMCAMTTTGLGYHRDTLSGDQLLEYMRLFYIDVALYIAVLGTIKLQILLQYLRLFGVRMRKLTIWVTGVVCVWSLASWLGCIFECNPVSGWWDPSVKAACLPQLPQWYFNAAGNIATDLVIFALPLPLLWKLNLPLNERLSLIGVFCLGFFTCCISMVRITSLSQPAEDFTYANIDASGWSVGETCLGVIVSCLPTLRPLLARTTRLFRRSSGAPQAHTPGRTLRTFGGGYIDSSGRHHAGPHTSAFGSTEGKHQTATVLSRTGSSTEELAGENDIGGDVEMALDVGKQQPAEPTLARWDNASGESSLGPDDEAVRLPIQQAPAPVMKGSKDYQQDSWLQKLSQMEREESLGLRRITKTTIHAGGPHQRLSTPLQPGTGTGIRVKRDVRQDSGPRYSGHE